MAVFGASLPDIVFTFGFQLPVDVPVSYTHLPNTLNWDLFTGPAKLNPYNNVYHPWNWRGWWDYGTGALGDMACHILHQPFRALKLGYPTKVEGSSTLLLSACAPQAQHVKMIFPARDNMPKVEMCIRDSCRTAYRTADSAKLLYFVRIRQTFHICYIRFFVACLRMLTDARQYFFSAAPVSYTHLFSG